MAPLVEPDHGRKLAEVGQEVPPDRALPIVLQMGEPAGGDQQRGAGAMHRIGDAHTVGGPAEPDLLMRVARPERSGHPSMVARFVRVDPAGRGSGSGDPEGHLRGGLPGAPDRIDVGRPGQQPDVGEAGALHRRDPLPRLAAQHLDRIGFRRQADGLPGSWDLRRMSGFDTSPIHR